METNKLLTHAEISIAVLLALSVIIRAYSYCRYHPVGKRRIGAWILMLSSFWYVLDNLRWLLLEGQTVSLYGIEAQHMFLIQVCMLVGANLVMRPNPRPIVDDDDYQEIMRHINESQCAWATKLREKQLEEVGVAHAKPI